MESRPAREWSTTAEPELLCHLGKVGRISAVGPQGRLNRQLDEAIERAMSSVNPLSSPLGTNMMDICPDPLVFSVQSGLPRLRFLDRQIDGGSKWGTHGDLSNERLSLVPRIAEISERASSAGRRMIRTVYWIDAYSSRGKLLGFATGTSIDIEQVPA